MSVSKFNILDLFFSQNVFEFFKVINVFILNIKAPVCQRYRGIDSACDGVQGPHCHRGIEDWITSQYPLRTIQRDVFLGQGGSGQEADRPGDNKSVQDH